MPTWSHLFDTFSWLIIYFSKKSSTFPKKRLISIGTKAVLPALVIVASAVPSIALAWLFSSAQAQGVVKEVKSSTMTAAGVQNMPLLVPTVAMAADLKPIDESKDIQIADSEAIVADIGWSGVSLDNIVIPQSEAISTYIVQSGDSVAAVAKRFGVSENTVRWANNMGKKDVLRVGQTLAILPITGVRHKVQKGDTLDTIAKKYKADKLDILDFNDISESGILAIGDTLIIPDGELTTIVASNPVTAKSTKVSTGAGVVKTGVSSSKGYYIQPVVPDGGRIRKTQGFHDRYNAVDVGAPIGTSIRAMAEGTVIVTKSPSGYNGGYGGLTIVSHANGSQTLYAHQSKILVKVGDKVSQGEVIGLTGNTGRSTGPHLHFEIRGVYPTPILY